MKTHPSLEARKTAFETHLIVDRGMTKATARMRSAIIRYWLRTWRTLTPTVTMVEKAKEQMILDGYYRDYVGNMCRAMKDYGAFIGVELRVKPPSREKGHRPKFLSEQDVQSFLFTVDTIRDRALFTVLAYSGLRCQELCNLRLEHVNFEKKTLLVVEGKGGKTAEVPVARPALDALSAYMRSGLRPKNAPWLFPAKHGEQLSTNRVRVLARGYGKKAGIPRPVSPHQFRHSLATNLISKGCPLPFVQRQLRHSRIETTMGYLHLTDAHLRENYERFVPSYG